MDLKQRLSAGRPLVVGESNDSFAEVKNRIHFAVIA
jgi:hypothetical protein